MAGERAAVLRGTGDTAGGRRLLYLDLLRCMAACCVIALHCVSGYVQSPALYGTRTWWGCLAVNAAARAGVPLFFMLSGYLNLSGGRALDMGRFYRRRLKRVLVPFLFWDAVYFLLRCLGGEEASLGTFFRELAVRGSEYHLWFVYELTAIYLLTPFLKRMADGLTAGQLWLLEGLILVPNTILPMVNTLLPVYIAPLPPLLEGYLGFYLLGYLLGRREPSAGEGRLACLLIPAGLALSIWGNARACSPEGIDLPMNLGYCLTHYLTAAGLFLLVRYGESRRPLGGRAARWVRGLSGASYGIYLSHVLVMSLASALPGRMGWDLTPAGNVLYLFTAALLGAGALSLVFGRVRGLRELV